MTMALHFILACDTAQGPLYVQYLVADMADLRAQVLPLVATVTAMLRQMEGELPVKLDAEEADPLPRIVTYEEMYGPITPAPPQEPVAPRIAPTRPRPRWRFRRPITWEWRWLW